MENPQKPLQLNGFRFHRGCGEKKQASTAFFYTSLFMHTTLFHRWINSVEPVEKKRPSKAVVYIGFDVANDFAIDIFQALLRFLPVIEFAHKPEGNERGGQRQRIVIGRINLKAAQNQQDGQQFGDVLADFGRGQA